MQHFVKLSPTVGLLQFATLLLYFAVLFEFQILIFFITGFIGSCLITVILEGFKVYTVS